MHAPYTLRRGGGGGGRSQEYLNEYLSRDPEAYVGKKRTKGRGAVRVLSLAPGNVAGKGWGAGYKEQAEGQCCRTLGC